MIIKSPPKIKSSEITPEKDYNNRRTFLKLSAFTLASAGLKPLLALTDDSGRGKYASLKYKKSRYGKGEQLNSWSDITGYNNFYEFGTGKSDPARNARSFKTAPWKVSIEGHCEKPGAYHVEDLIKDNELEERIYRLRCVEAWSMVVPWLGIPLRTLIEKARPTSKARFVEFTTLYDPRRMPGQRDNILDWPYVEGLRMDEAMHPLTLMAVGVYGKVLPGQNGAPLRLVVPWKYGFKSIKSVVRIRFVEKRPLNSWQQLAPREYGFYANVNPQVDHPRWSQKRERRIGTFFKIETRMFNGYADEVGGMYSGMDLKKWY
ncbi:MAG TPA: protein-methionine-sulfoxide reductase catalytic subunit MsrP [Caldithrix abyssi]|uniref:Protein-methionine-sulfoxide reductase catalytic subunit MsrP n=1 Tax=Caldithrix abyssi TaxID=187145 RepID=A0A7V1PTH4_CALAY|nr:protein-methionine-sulfoxide reductase catalytic subunit MsrP [Caldithrix abyssi]